MNSELIIESAKKGSDSAFRSLYDDHCEMVYKLAYRFTGSNEDSEEIMQETFTKAFRCISDLSDNTLDSFKYWITRICINTSISQLRKIKNRKKRFVLSLSENTENFKSSEDSPDAVIDYDSIRKIIKQTVETFSSKQKIIFHIIVGGD